MHLVETIGWQMVANRLNLMADSLLVMLFWTNGCCYRHCQYHSCIIADAQAVAAVLVVAAVVVVNIDVSSQAVQIKSAI